MEESVLVAKIDKNNEINLKEFYEFLKEENIEYEEKLEEEWKGIRQPKYIANIAFYINKEDEAKVRKFIKDIENANIQVEEYDELKINKEERQKEEETLKKSKKIQKNLQRIMIYGIFGIVVLGLIISVISNLKIN